MDDIPYDQLTNYQKWRIFTKGLMSPDSYIDFGFYFLISGALQRRVWCPPSHKPIYANQFITFVAPPGVGKGLVTSSLMEIFKHHRMPDPHNITIVNGTKTGDIDRENVVEVDRPLVEAAASINASMAGHEQRKSGRKDTERPTIIPVAPDASSYAALVQATAHALRLKRYVEYDIKLARNLTKLYTHSSITFCLEEISSMFRKQAEDVVYFLQQAYDCGDYAKDTKTQGCDRIQKCCVNIIGGTTPETMRKIFRDGLLNEGYASRCIHIFEAKNRVSRVFIPELDDTQKRCRDDILSWILKLTDLYGQIELQQEAVDWLETWWKAQEEGRAGVSDKLSDYYARKKVHTIKMAIAKHFSEHLHMKIDIACFKWATEMLGSIEPRMHLALVHTAENPLYRVGLKVIKFLEDKGEPQTFHTLFAKFYEDLPGPDVKVSMEKVLEYNIMMNKIVAERKDGKDYYKIP